VQPVCQYQQHLAMGRPFIAFAPVVHTGCCRATVHHQQQIRTASSENMAGVVLPPKTPRVYLRGVSELCYLSTGAHLEAAVRCGST
jgi:hypothetical protein